MAIMLQSSTTPAMAHVLHIWQSAAQAIQTDPDTARRHAYELAIAAICAETPEFATIHDLIAYYWSGQLQARAAQMSVSFSGHVLNYQVVAAAVCQQALAQAMLAR